MRYKSTNNAQCIECISRQPVESQCITLHPPPPFKCALVGVIFHVVSECHRMTPTENRDVIDFVLEGVSRLKAIIQRRPLPRRGAVVQYTHLCAVSLMTGQWGHKDLSLGGFPTQPCFTSVDPKLFYRIPTALPCSVIWILESAVDADYFFTRRKRWMISP